jgi:hypothetical protein
MRAGGIARLKFIVSRVRPVNAAVRANMIPPNIEPGRVAEVARIKNTARQHQSRTIRTLGMLFIAGVVVATAVWFVQRPMDRDGVHFGLAAGLGLGNFVLGGLLWRMLFPRPRAECPECGYDWNKASRNDIETWLTWDRCPRCGLRMCDEEEMPDSP